MVQIVIGIFIFLFLVMIGRHSNKKDAAETLKEDKGKVKNIYGPDTPYLKRADLTDEDIEHFRYLVEECDEILLTVNSIQELKVILMQHFQCRASEISIYDSGEVIVQDDYSTRWRYTSSGLIEYYRPATKPKIQDDMDILEEYADDLGVEFSESEYDSPQTNTLNKNSNVIKGPW